MPLVVGAVTAEPIDLAALQASVDDPGAGAMAIFAGRVRNHDRAAAGEVLALDYTAHPSAAEVIQQIVVRVLAELDPSGTALASAVHRMGRLTVGDLALVVCVATPHRELAFRLCSELVERIKQELPIWKQQFEADGSHTWAGLDG